MRRTRTHRAFQQYLYSPRTKRNVRIAVHERQPSRVHTHLRLISAEQYSLTTRSLRPMQYLVSVKVPGRVDQRRTARKRFRLSRPERDVFMSPHHPLPISLVKKDGCVVKSQAPFHHRRVIVRMRNGDRRDPTQLLDLSNRRFIEQRNTVPQDVAFGRSDKKRLFADSQIRLRVNREKACFLLLNSIRILAP